MKSCIIILVGLLSSFYANAGYLNERSFDINAESYMKLLDQVPTENWDNIPADKKAYCSRRYDGILKDKVLDIRISLGYFDWTAFTSPIGAGPSPSIDLGAYAALRKLLLSNCRGNARFCGFRPDYQGNSRFTRDIQIAGKTYTARVELHHSSVSESFRHNTGAARYQQQQRTQFMENFYAQSLQKADAAFYFGHSRNGGGPDFAPPVLVRGRVDYDGHYIPKKPGAKHMIGALSGTNTPAPIIGLMSCDSRDHFLRKIQAVAPNSGIITTTAVLGTGEAYTALIGATDALLRGQCRNFYQSLRLTKSNAKYVTMDGMFE